MSRHHLIDLLIAIVFVIALMFTAREAFATAGIVSQGHASDAIRTAKCEILPPQMSIQTGYAAERGIWVTYSGQGPTGVDGGLMYLLSTYPTCPR